MANKYIIICFLIGLTVGIISTVFFMKKNEPAEPEFSIYEYEMTRIENKKLKDSVERLKTNVRIEKIYDSIYRDRIIYKTIYEKIPFSSSSDRDSAFDTLLSN